MFNMFSKKTKSTAAKILLNRLPHTQIRSYSDETQELDALKRRYDALDGEGSLLKSGEKYLKLKEKLDKSEKTVEEDDDVLDEHSPNSFGR